MRLTVKKKITYTRILQENGEYSLSDQKQAIEINLPDQIVNSSNKFSDEVSIILNLKKPRENKTSLIAKIPFSTKSSQILQVEKITNIQFL